MTKTVTPSEYRGWTVTAGRWPEPAFIATHPDYDASYEGPEDGWVDNGLKADGATYEDVCAEIDAIMEDHPHFAPNACDVLERILNSGCAISQGLRLDAEAALVQVRKRVAA